MSFSTTLDTIKVYSYRRKAGSNFWSNVYAAADTRDFVRLSVWYTYVLLAN